MQYILGHRQVGHTAQCREFSTKCCKGQELGHFPSSFMHEWHSMLSLGTYTLHAQVDGGRARGRGTLTE